MSFSRQVLQATGLFAASLCLSVLVSCGTTQTQAPTSSSSSTNGEPSAQHAGMSHGRKININNAILSELDKLEAKLGIPALSGKIQSSRPYVKPEELVSKKVITQAQFDQVKEMVTIEEIVLTGEAKDIDYMLKLGLMKGHMMVARELLDLKKPDQAEPHIGHPVEEIYADVEDQLKERNVKEFKSVLSKLQAMVKAGAKDPVKTDEQFKLALDAIEGAIAMLPEKQRKDEKFVLQVMVGLLDTASSEYGAAIADGKIKEAIEYQDSRGFVMYSQELYKAIAPQVKAKSVDSEKQITTALTDLRLAWPSPVPPVAPVKSVDDVTKLIKSVETIAQKSL
ncbi:MAG: helix-hairpin-helix domain-containing protein [Alkalinema sp. FL-bin-369]|nr:helix-hairpin-helix domain-containing protein [Leptolyngbyaceae cyanobacterium LF-bin-369]